MFIGYCIGIGYCLGIGRDRHRSQQGTCVACLYRSMQGHCTGIDNYKQAQTRIKQAKTRVKQAQTRIKQAQTRINRQTRIGAACGPHARLGMCRPWSSSCMRDQHIYGIPVISVQLAL